MEIHVVIATRGRAQHLQTLLQSLAAQTHPPSSVTVVGVTESDVMGIDTSLVPRDTQLKVLLSGKSGLCLQRNLGMERVFEITHREAEFIAVFFDDDFRPKNSWLQECALFFGAHRDVVAMTGRVLADGGHGRPISEEEARAYLSGETPAMRHWTAGKSRDLTSMYGCNMAFRSSVMRACRFDDRLPLYAWQEDRDFTSQALKHGRAVLNPRCKGVHLGSSSGRVSGVRLGYSQVANSLYLVKKGTMGKGIAARFIAQHLVSNLTRSLVPVFHARVDYPGRLNGNVMAIFDILRARCEPERVEAIC